MSRIMELLSAIQSGTTPPSGASPETFRPLAPVASPRPAAASFIEHFDLRENPFGDSVNLEYYFRSASHEETFQQMAATVRDGISLGLVTGSSGTGKTIISQLLLQGLDPSANRAVLTLVTPGMTRTALLREILREAGITEVPTRNRELLELLHGTVIDLHRQGRRLVVLIDEAQFLQSDALHLLRTLSNLESPREKLCTCLLFAEERFLRRLEHPIHRSLATRMYHRSKLRALELEEVVQYVRFRTMVAGGRPELFTADSIQALFKASGGVCREVNRLAYLALEAGWRQGRGRVDADLVATA